MDTTPWNNHHQDAAGSRENGGHYYGSNVPYVDSLSAILASASGLIINQAFRRPFSLQSSFNMPELQVHIPPQWQ
eukprot:scaffold12911_cov135-Skeletonema_marinoi.AAC.1